MEEGSGQSKPCCSLLWSTSRVSSFPGGDDVGQCLSQLPGGAWPCLCRE